MVVGIVVTFFLIAVFVLFFVILFLLWPFVLKLVIRHKEKNYEKLLIGLEDLFGGYKVVHQELLGCGAGKNTDVFFNDTQKNQGVALEAARKLLEYC